MSCLGHFFPLFSQSMDEIKKRQEKTEKEINYLNKLLATTRDDQLAALEKLTLLSEKIRKGKEMVQSFVDEVSYLERLIVENGQTQAGIESNKQQMLDLYREMVYNTWKKKNRSDRLAYLFSSSTAKQAYIRYKHFEQVQDCAKEQLNMIRRANDSLLIMSKELNSLLNQKGIAQKRLLAQNEALLKEQTQANVYANELKKKEQELGKKLKVEIANREKYKKELQKLIDSQIKKSGSTTFKYNLTPKEKLISEDFAKNQGRFPWPVAEGVISEKFGVNVSPLAKQVKLNNDGITIATSANAEVRAIFGGDVAEIVFIQGQNNVILVRHGNFFTLYNNLVEVFVKKGEQVQVKQSIGKLASADGKGSTLNFQIWRDKDILDPQMWLSK